MNPNQKPQEDVVGLLPCPNPWCNSQCRDRPEPFVRYYESSCRYRVNCDICPQIGPSGETADEARTAWNTRAAPTYEAGRRDMREAADEPLDYIDLFRIIRRAGRKDAAKAKAVHDAYTAAMRFAATEPLGGEQS